MNIDRMSRQIIARELRRGHIQLAICVLFLPRGYHLRANNPKSFTLSTQYEEYEERR